MSLSKLTDDLNIVQGLDDEPNDVGGLTSEELKAKFDEAGNAIKNFINNTLTEEADSTLATKADVQSVVLGQIPDGTITAEKLVDGIEFAPAAHKASHSIGGSDALKSTDLGLDPTTAAKYFASLVGTESVDQVLSLLGRFQRGLGNEYVWKKFVSQKVLVQSDVTSSGSFNTAGVLYYSSGATFDSSNNISLLAPTTLINSIDAITASNLIGKYIQQSTVRYVVSASYSSGTISYTYKMLSVSTVESDISYVNSSDPAAYPPTVSDGYAYTLLGQIGNKAQIATGSYTGTGTYGSSNPNSLVCNGTPHLLFITDTTVGLYAAIFIIGGSNYILESNGTVTGVSSCYQSVSGGTVSWYHTSYDVSQMNAIGHVYRYTLIFM